MDRFEFGVFELQFLDAHVFHETVKGKVDAPRDRSTPTWCRQNRSIASPGYVAAPPHDRYVLRGVSASDLSLTLPHPVYALGLIDIGNDRPLTTSKPTGWRFLIVEADRVIAGIEVDIASDTKELRFGRIVQGPFEAATETAIRAAESSAHVRETTFEVHLLRVPALTVEALWLRARDAGKDVFVPLAPAPARFDAFHLYPKPSFLALLRAEAEAHPAFDSSPRIAVPAG